MLGSYYQLVSCAEPQPGPSRSTHPETLDYKRFLSYPSSWWRFSFPAETRSFQTPFRQSCAGSFNSARTPVLKRSSMLGIVVHKSVTLYMDRVSALTDGGTGSNAALEIDRGLTRTLALSDGLSEGAPSARPLRAPAFGALRGLQWQSLGRER